MFRFEDPYVLLLLVLVPVMVFYRRKRCPRPTLRISSAAAAIDLPTGFFVKLAEVMPALTYVALVLMILSLARPQWGTRQVDVQTKGVNMILAVDLSESMAALDFNKGGSIINRLEAVKGVIRQFVAKRNGDRIGLVVFGSHAYTQLPLTRDYDTIVDILDRVKIGAAGKSTAIGDAIGISLKRLEDIESKSNVIILLTDGRSNSGELSPEAAVEIAVQKNVKIYTIGVGTEGEAPFRVNVPGYGERYVYQRVDMDEKTLKSIAKTTQGLYFRAEDTQKLEKIYKTIDELEKTEVTVKTYDNYRDLYAHGLGAAFCLLGVWLLLSYTRLLRVP